MMWYLVEYGLSRYLQVKGFRPCQEDTFAISYLVKRRRGISV